MEEPGRGARQERLPGAGEEPQREPGAEAEPEQREPRLRRVNREQLLLRPTDLEKLIPEDHPARPHSGARDLGVRGALGLASLLCRDPGGGRQGGTTGAGPAVADQRMGLCLQPGGECGAGGVAALPRSSGLPVADGAGADPLSRFVGLPSRPPGSVAGVVHPGAGVAERGRSDYAGTGDARWDEGESLCGGGHVPAGAETPGAPGSRAGACGADGRPAE